MGHPLCTDPLCTNNMQDIIPIENITSLIYLIRGQKVLLDRDLAVLYGVETRVLKQAVRRNRTRFPADFMFELTLEEDRSLRSQNVTLKRGGHSKYPPMAFTEQGVAMLSSVLKSESAIQVNIQIMRAFTKLRQLIIDNAELRKEIENLRTETEGKFEIVFKALDQLLNKEAEPKKKIGFTAKEKQGVYETVGSDEPKGP